MKNFTLLLCIFIITHFALAQTETNTSFASQMNTMFSPLDKNNVPQGILLDYGMEFTNVPAFNGTLTDSTYTNLTAFKQIYNTLLSSRIRDVTTGFVTPQTFDTNLKYSRTTNVITLGGLYFKYATFIDNATVNGKLTYSGGKFYDKYTNGVWQNPYQERKTFVLAATEKIHKGFNIQVKLPSSIFYSNVLSEVQSIEIDFGNGQGYVTVPFNQIVNVSYTSEGVKTWTYKLNLTSSASLYSRSRIKIEEGLTTIPWSERHGNQN
ncbi:hypothetical protein [Mariniflexile sp.]|uniref:hypothetical protein n=1 Tax=Mariniflexile sp. TaxID=1979402 RepID=UPI003566FE26